MFSYTPAPTLRGVAHGVQSLNLPERLKNKGESNTGRPAEEQPVPNRNLFDVLHLLPHLLNNHLHIHRAARSLEILGLR
jgi:hypothetical protein